MCVRLLYSKTLLLLAPLWKEVTKSYEHPTLKQWGVMLSLPEDQVFTLSIWKSTWKICLFSHVPFQYFMSIESWIFIYALGSHPKLLYVLVLSLIFKPTFYATFSWFMYIYVNLIQMVLLYPWSAYLIQIRVRLEAPAACLYTCLET